MKTSHLQSMIALNARRITAKHTSIENAIAEAKRFKASVFQVSPAYRVHVQAMVEKAYKIADKGREELKKAVELQKALQAELRANRAAERAEAEAAKPKAKSRFFTHVTGFLDGTFCVEVISKGHHICHKMDGRQNHHYGNILEVAEYGVRKGSWIEHDSMPSQRKQAPGVYSIDEHGQPKEDGVYDVMYEWQGQATEQREFRNGEWVDMDGGLTFFGNSNTRGERYIVK